MLILQRMTHFNEFMKCKASGKILMYGDFYYLDTDTGDVIDAKYYHDAKEKQKRDNWINTHLIDEAKDQKDYQDQLQKAEQEYIASTMLDKPVFDKYSDILAKGVS